MPELPEVETIRRQLAPLVEGRRLERVEILDARWSRPLAPRELADALQGRRVEELGRRGKYLVWSLEDDVHLAQHLRMTGAVLADPNPEPPHTRVRIRLGRLGRSGAERRLLIRGAAAPASCCSAPRRWRSSSPPAWAWSRWTSCSPRSTCAGWRAGGPRRSRRSCSISAASPGWATSTPTRPCSAQGSTRCAPPDGCQASSTCAYARARSRRCRPASTHGGRRSTTSATSTACAGPSRTSFSCTGARESRAGAVARRS